MAEQKKILIFTYMLNNYGAVLQSYALQSYLKKQGCNDVRVVNFETKRHQQLNKIYKKRSSNFFIQLVFMILTTLKFSKLNRRKKRTALFKKKFMCFTQKFQSQEQLFTHLPDADIFISGSDQVFNPNGLNKDVYYLDFPKGYGKKIAYAPSFGSFKGIDKVSQDIKRLLMDFDALSCRENEGSDYMSKLLSRPVLTVADPTLLLSKNEWKEISNTPKFDGNYILIYDLNGGESLICIAKKIQKRTGLKIICITDKVQKRYNVDKQIYDAGPSEFVGLIEMASYVVTDSFHGTMFSLIFNIPFYTYIAVPSSSSRILNILKRLNLLDRVIDFGKEETWNGFDESIRNYNKEMNSFLLESKDFINKNICSYEQ